MTSADWPADQELVILPLCVLLLSVCVCLSLRSLNFNNTPVKKKQGTWCSGCTTHTSSILPLYTSFFPRTDPPDDSPSCSVEPALNHTSLRLLCSWPGGFPSPSLWWTGDLIPPRRDDPETNLQTNAAILLSGEDLTSNNSLFTCVGLHRALKEATTCHIHTCEKEGKKAYLHVFFYSSTPSCYLLSRSRCPPCRASVFCLCDKQPTVPDAVLLLGWRGSKSFGMVGGPGRSEQRWGGKLQHPDSTLRHCPQWTALHLPC